MSQGKKLPAFIIRHYPDREGAKSTRIGALWRNSEGSGFSGGIEYIPLDALTSGRLNISVWPYEPKKDQQDEGA